MWLQIPERPEAAGKPRRRPNRVQVLRIVLIAIAVGAALIVGVRIWTAAPDTVRVIITHHAGNGSAPDVVTTVYDRAVHDAALAQRLQRDLAALPIASPIDRMSCPSYYNYDTYILEWSRSGLFVERAAADTPGCTVWIEDSVIARYPTSETIFLDMNTMLGTPLPQCSAALPRASCHPT
ncbi:MAG TPA: hypothetical protein VF116_09815 [Ktedonobacterales bacterium]